MRSRAAASRLPHASRLRALDAWSASASGQIVCLGHGASAAFVGPLQDQIGLLAALRPHERVLVLLQLLGSQQRVELARSSIEAV
jgi:hypothetical protein